MMKIRHSIPLLLAVALKPLTTDAFTSPAATITTAQSSIRAPLSPISRKLPPQQSILPPTSTTGLSLFPTSVAVQTVSQAPLIRRAVVAVLSSLFLFIFRDRILWPGYSRKDPNLAAPLPPGTRGCPLLGHPTIMVGNKKSGPFSWYQRAGLRFMDKSRVFRFFFMGSPAIAVSGGANINNIASREFQEDGVEPINGISTEYMGESLILEPDAKRHAALRKLVGQALTPKAVQQALPALMDISEKQVDKMIHKKDVIAETVCTDLTLDFAWKQILGLKLETKEEIDEFVEKVDIWNKGMADLRTLTGVGLKTTAGYKAYLWLRQKIEDQMDALLESGPDDSTLSGLVFAQDDEAQAKLPRKDVIDNAIALILAGTETSASTLTNAFLCIGKRPETWKKIQEEVDGLSAKYASDGQAFLKAVISEKEGPYLDGAIKEALRIKPIVSGAPRKARAAFEIDGYQVPKGFMISPNILITHTLDPATYKEDQSHMNVSKGFQPERWLSPETKPTSDFLPFGAGPHFCLGYNLAYAEMKIFLAIAASKMNFELTGSAAQEPVEWQAKFTFIPKQLDGVPMTVTAR